MHHTFTRTSGFYFNSKDNTFYEKEGVLYLGEYIKKSWTQIGKMKINLGEYVDKGEVHRLFDFKDKAQNIKVQTTFRIDSGVEQSSASVKKIEAYFTTKVVKKAAEEIAELKQAIAERDE